MKNLLLLLVLLSTVQAVKANETVNVEQTKQDIEECLNELEMQHSDDKNISALEYVEMERECRRLGDLPKLILYKGSY
jgi:hypothetical protein